MGRGRPGGNPELRKIAAQKVVDNPTDEPLKVLSIRIEPYLIEKIKEDGPKKFRAKLRELYGNAN